MFLILFLDPDLDFNNDFIEALLIVELRVLWVHKNIAQNLNQVKDFTEFQGKSEGLLPKLRAHLFVVLTDD